MFCFAAEEIEREPNLRSEDVAMKRHRSLSLEAAFGEYQQPVLESLRFKVLTPASVCLFDLYLFTFNSACLET